MNDYWEMNFDYFLLVGWELLGIFDGFLRLGQHRPTRGL
jgi:hypothetical protein